MFSEFDPGVHFIAFAVLLFSLTVHESAHAWTAWRLGDSTARNLGRVSLNPLVHMDPIGTVLLPVVAMLTGAPLIGWAKPVPVDGRFLRNWRRDFVLVSLAGPLSNVLLAGIASVALRAISPASPGPEGFDVVSPFQLAAAAAFEINVLLAVFNLIPIPPLDGGNVLSGVLRGRIAQGYDAIRPYGIFVLYALLLSGTLNTIIGPPYVFLRSLLTL